MFQSCPSLFRLVSDIDSIKGTREQVDNRIRRLMLKARSDESKELSNSVLTRKLDVRFVVCGSEVLAIPA